MTKARSLLSVRLDPELTEKLERYCAETGATRSQVAQQSMAQYLVAQTGPTLGSLAEAVLASGPRGIPRRTRASRQKRFRDYVREKRRR